MTSTARPIAIYYEHPEWFRPLFAELDRRGIPHVALDAARHRYDATNGDGSQYGLVFNRMSPSAHLRGRGHSILYTLNYLAHLEHLGVRVVNGLGAFRIETSKALQLALLKSLGLPFPAARVINHPDGSAGGRRRLAVPGRGQGQHRRQRRRHRPLRHARGPRPGGRRGPRRPGPRRHRPRAGVHPRSWRHHHPGRGARRTLPLRHRR